VKLVKQREAKLDKLENPEGILIQSIIKTRYENEEIQNF